MPLTDKRIGVLMGGTSAEREVSLKSGAAVFRALQDLGYDAVSIDAGPDICDRLRREKIEAAFLVLHGGHGENGAVQGLLEVLGIPYTGSGVLASALAMDKETTKKVFLYHGVPVPPFRVLTGSECGVPGDGSGKEEKDSLHIAHCLSLIDFPMPWVVKPATEGSSIGVNIVREADDVNQALMNAFRFGGRVVIEKYLEGKEVQVGVLNNTVLGSVEVRPKTEFYSYEAKYTPGLTEYILPPEVERGILDEAEKAALRAHKSLGCRGATRVDLIIDRDGRPYVLEVNTIPGMTETSLLPKIARQSGLDFPSLIEEILKEAVTEGKGS